MPLRTFVFATASLLPAVAHAQSLVSYSLRFVEVAAGTNTPVPQPDGFVAPGEAARIELTVGFTPSVGSTIIYTPPPPPGIGAVAGLSDIWTELRGTGSAQGTWSFLGRAPGWALGGIGTPSASGEYLGDIAAGQFVLPGATANPANPIEAIWRGVWTPASYSPRSVQWTSARFGSSLNDGVLLVQYASGPGGPQYVGLAVHNGQYGQVSIPIIPAPSSALVLVTALALRRRRPPQPLRPQAPGLR